MADLDSEFAAAEEDYKKSVEAVDDRIKGQQADDRSLIAKWIVFSFVGMVARALLLPERGANQTRALSDFFQTTTPDAAQSGP